MIGERLLNILKARCDGRLDALTGPHNATARQDIMRVCGETLPKSKCGINVVIRAVVRQLHISDDCYARQSAAVYRLVHRPEPGKWFHELCSRLATEATTAYSRNVNQQIYCYGTPGEDGIYRDLAVVRDEDNTTGDLVIPEPVPRHIPYSQYAEWFSRKLSSVQCLPPEIFA
jgi:hypothetical protein